MNAFESMGTDGKSERDLLVELHTHVLGPNGVMERVKVIEQKVEAVETFKTRWAAMASVIVIVLTLVGGVIKEWLVAFFKGGNNQ